MPFEVAQVTNSEGIARVKERLSGFETEAGRRKGLAFVPKPGDVLISTTPKAGTTWMQQICHQLRTGGDMKFEEISDVAPYIELAHDLDQDLEAVQPGAPPRIFKTHCWRPHCPRSKEEGGSKTIVVVRNPPDVAVSFFKFFRGWFFAPGEVELDAFVREFWLARGAPESEMQNASAFHHMLSWWPHRLDEDVLWVHFEDMKSDLPSVVQRVAKFIGADTSQDNLDNATRSSSYAFMAKHADKFSERTSKLKRNKACGLEPGAGMGQSKVRDGKVGAAKAEMSELLRAEVDARWTELMLPATGCASYDEMRTKTNQELAAAGRL